MSTAPHISRYHALDGTELLKWVLLDAGQKLAESSEFSKARAYHNPKYTIHIKIETYDSSATYVQADAGFKVEGQKTPGDLPPEAKPVTLEPTPLSTGPIKAPDEVRDQLQDGRYKTKVVEGTLCDVKDAQNWGDIGKKSPAEEEKEKKALSGSQATQFKAKKQ
jgi:hypothetical protein